MILCNYERINFKIKVIAKYEKRYTGRSMTTYGTTIPFCRSIAASSFKTHCLTNEAKQRLKVLDWYFQNRKNISLTSRRYGYHRKTIANWVKRYNKKGILGLSVFHILKKY